MSSDLPADNAIGVEMLTLREAPQNAETNKIALGHFNVLDLSVFHAVVRAGRRFNLPLMIGVSEGERGFIGLKEIALLVRIAREECGVSLYRHADHTRSAPDRSELALLVERGDVKPPMGQVFGLDQAREARDMSQQGRPRAKSRQGSRKHGLLQRRGFRATTRNLFAPVPQDDLARSYARRVSPVVIRSDSGGRYSCSHGNHAGVLVSHTR